MLALTDFTEENGATRVVPGSHRTGASSLDEKEAEQAVSVELKRGDLLIWDSNLWHGGGANRTDSRRIGLLTFWLVGWVRPDDNLLLLLPREKNRRVSTAFAGIGRVPSLPRRLRPGRGLRPHEHTRPRGRIY